MLIAREIRQLKRYAGRVAVAIGVFDGVHMGHRTILGEMVALCRARGHLPVAVTFEPHPAEVLGKAAGADRLTTLAEKARLIAATGVDFLLAIPFDRSFADLSARDFVHDFLAGPLDPKAVHVGFNFSFGRRGEGDARLLSDLGEVHGFAVRVFGPLMGNGEVVSSTRIREAVLAGDVRRATRLLGRPYRLRGEVVHGDGRGSSLGFPTANVEPDPCVLRPGGGVYAAWAAVGGRAWPAVVNVGTRPTFGEGGQATVEAHLVGFSGTIYGRSLEILFVERMRDEMRFATSGSLSRQIDADIADALRALNLRNTHGAAHDGC